MTFDEFLQRPHPFLTGMCESHLRRLADHARQVHFAAGSSTFHEGDPAEHFYLIHRGHVAIQTFVPGPGVATIQTVGAGEALGWSWLYPPYRWHFSAVAVEPVEAAALCARTLRDRMREDHEFGCEIALRVGQVMLERLQATRLRLLEMYGAPG